MLYFHHCAISLLKQIETFEFVRQMSHGPWLRQLNYFKSVLIAVTKLREM